MKTSFGYTFRTTPRQHQVEDLERSYALPAWARFHEMRTGKGVLTCYEVDALAQEGAASRFLVVCPKRVVSTWVEMIQTHANTPFIVLTDPKDALLAGRLRSDNPVYDKPTILLLNYDRVWDRQGRRLIANPAVVDWQPEFIVADEAHKIKNRASNRSKALHLLGRMAKYRRVLTGTPDPTSWADYFSIYKFLDPSIFETWTQFTAQYLILDWWKNVIGYRNIADLAQKVHSISSVIKRVTCLDVPAEEERTVKVELPASVKKVYKDMAVRMMHEMVEGEHESVGGKRIVSAAIVLTKLLRLAQITGGFVKLDDGTYRWLHDTKMNTMMDVLEEVLSDGGAKAVVFFRFRAEMEHAAEALRRQHIRFAELHGETPNDGAVQSTFLRDRAVRVLLCQIATGSLGIDLSIAETAIFYSWDFDAATYQQARDRIWKPGGKITRIHLVVPHSIDETMLQVVQGKIDRSALLLDRWQEIIQGGLGH